MMLSQSDFYTFEYMHGQQRETHIGLLADFESRSAAAVEKLPNALNVSYGAEPRQLLDIFFAEGPCRGTILYLHPGYWQSRDKSSFRFLAGPFVARGYNFVLANYPLCPEVALDVLVERVSEAVPFVLTYLRGRHPSNRGLIAIGHSAGGHLATELALRTWPSTVCQGHPIQRVIAISGIYELVPLIATPLNIKLQLTETEAKRNSPLLRVGTVGIPAIFLVGGGETSEFKRQSLEMATMWGERGNPAYYVEMDDSDHFSVLDPFSKLQHPRLLEAFGNSG